MSPPPARSVSADPYADLAAQTLARGHLRLRTLILLRWLAVAGQTAAVLVVQFAFDFPLPLAACLAAIAASAWLNIFASLRYPLQKSLTDTESAAYLAYDIAQLAVLLYLTGGIENPFTLLFLAPVTISASVLSLRATLALGLFALICVTVLAVFHFPLPWPGGAFFVLPSIYVAGIWTSLVLGLSFSGIYSWRVASERARMSEALAATQVVLAREQRLSALGGLAAAAAHELGTPLGTIHLVAREMAKETSTDHPLREDIDLLASQAERCREILGRLSARGEEGDAVHDRLGLNALMQEIIDEFAGAGKTITTSLGPVDGSSAEPPDIARRPEILYGLGNIIENAVDFAVETVEIEGCWDAETIDIRIVDDGPGFSLDILPRLGEPYVTSRPAARADARIDDDADEGMGLGFFIAKTLLERTGGAISFENRDPEQGGGAAVTVRWSRASIEAPALSRA